MKRILTVAVLGLLAYSGAWAQSADENLTPKCTERPGNYPVLGNNRAFAQCWQELYDVPGCHVYRSRYHSGGSVRGAEECRGGVLKCGAVTTEGDWGQAEGPYAEGKRHGRWVERYADGRVRKGRYVNDEREGSWMIYRLGDRRGFFGSSIDSKCGPEAVGEMICVVKFKRGFRLNTTLNC